MANTDTTIVIRAQDKTKAALRSVRGSLNGVAAAATSVTAQLAAVAGIGSFALLTASAFKSIDALAKTADKLGVTTESLAGMRHAAELTGVATNTMDMALQRFTRRTAEAAKGTGEAKDALKELGLDAKALAALSPDQAFIKVADAMGNVATQGDRVRLAMKLFDSEGVALVNTMALGADGIREAMIEAEALGLAVSRVDAKSIENTNDAVTRMQGLTTGLGNAIAVKLSGPLTAMVNQWVDATVAAGGFAGMVDDAFNFSVKAVGVFADALLGIEVIFAALQVAAAAFSDGFWSALTLIDKAVTSVGNTIITGLLYPLQKVLEAASWLGSEMATEALTALDGLQMGASTTLAAIRNNAGSNFQEMKDNLHNLMMEKLPSQAIDEWVADVQVKTEAAAAVIKESVVTALAPDPALVAAGTAAAIEARLVTVQDGINAERELLAVWWDESRQKLIDDLESKKITEEGYTAGILALRQQLANKSVAIQDKAAKAMTASQIWAAKSTKDKTKDILGFLGEQTAGMAKESKTAFKIHKAISLAKAVISGYESAVAAYAWGTSIGGPYVGAAMAAVSVAATAAQISQIASQSFSGGGSGSGAAITASGSAPVVEQDFAPAQQQTLDQEQKAAGITMVFNGPINSNDAERLLNDFKDLINNGDHVLIEPSSRNGRTLAA